MKKLSTLLAALLLCVALVACGGPNKQPAIDAFNSASNAFNGVAAVINKNPGGYDKELIDVMVEMAGLLQEYQEFLSGDEEATQEQLDDMVEWFADVEDWVDEVKKEYDIK